MALVSSLLKYWTMVQLILPLFYSFLGVIDLTLFFDAPDQDVDSLDNDRDGNVGNVPRDNFVNWGYTAVKGVGFLVGAVIGLYIVSSNKDAIRRALGYSWDKVAEMVSPPGPRNP